MKKKGVRERRAQRTRKKNDANQADSVSTHRGGFFMACAGLWLGMSRVAANVRRQASFHGIRGVYPLVAGLSGIRGEDEIGARLDSRWRDAIHAPLPATARRGTNTPP